MFHVKHGVSTTKLIQLLGKSICIDRWKIRENMLFSLVFLAYRDQSCLRTLNKLQQTNCFT